MNDASRQRMSEAMTESWKRRRTAAIASAIDTSGNAMTAEQEQRNLLEALMVAVRLGDQELIEQTGRLIYASGRHYQAKRSLEVIR